MGLELQYEYTDKQGNIVQLKYPKIELMGKLMDDGEELTMQCLQDQINVFPYQTRDGKGGANYTLFCKIPDTDNAFTLQLSGQAYMCLKELQLQKFDIFKVTKSWKDNPKNGAKLPIIQAEIVSQNQQLGSTQSGVPTGASYPRRPQGINPNLPPFKPGLHTEPLQPKAGLSFRPIPNVPQNKQNEAFIKPVQPTNKPKPLNFKAAQVTAPAAKVDPLLEAGRHIIEQMCDPSLDDDSKAHVDNMARDNSQFITFMQRQDGFEGKEVPNSTLQQLYQEFIEMWYGGI